MSDNFTFKKYWNGNVEEGEGRNGRFYVRNGRWMWAIFQNEELVDNFYDFSEVKRKYPTAKRLREEIKKLKESKND
jgi:hypothetical protein